MRSNLELLKIKPDNKYITSTDEEITGMEHIIDSLLFLAKPDGKNNLENINITKNTEKIVEKYQNETIIIFKSKSKSIIQSINTDLYDRIICNLIENAIKYKSG
jgi:signal transduction histidine kinase